MSETFDRSQFPPITALGDALRASQMAWRDLPSDCQKVLEYDLMPYTVTDPVKAGWVQKWFLKASQADIDAINELLPPHTKVAGRELTKGGFALSCDLLSDSRPGETYSASREILESLVLIYDPDFIPVNSTLP